MPKISKAIRQPATFCALIALVATMPMLIADNAYADCVAAKPKSSSDPAPDFPKTTTSPSVRCNDATATNPIVSGSGNLTVNDATTFVDTYKQGQNQTTPSSPTTTPTGSGATLDTAAYATGGGTLLQLDGHGRTLTVNSGAAIENFRNIAGNRTAVVMGANTVAASNAASFNADAFTPSSSATVSFDSATNRTTIKLSSVPSTTWVGQSLTFGRFDTAANDFFAGQSYKITSVDTTAGNFSVTIQGTGQLPANFAEGGGASTSLPIRYSVTANYGAGQYKTTPIGTNVFYNNVVENSGTIAARIQQSELNTTATGSPAAPFASNVKAVTTSAAGSYLIDNKSGGVISASTAEMGGNIYATEANDNVSRLDILNAGTIVAECLPALALQSATAIAAPTAKVSGFAYDAANITNVNALNLQEEPELVNVYNSYIDSSHYGIMRSKGDYTGTLFMRAETNNVTNYGLIEHLSAAGGTDYSKGYAIGVMSTGGEARDFSLLNGETGVIHGDILAVNSNALRWELLSTVGTTTTTAGVTTSNLAQGLNDRLIINANTGQVDSEITNKGTIIGNFWLSNGEHEIENEESGKVTGNIDIDQRATLVHAIASACTVTSTGLANATGCVGAGGTTVVTTSITTVADEEDPANIITSNYRIVRTTGFGSDTSTITETVTVTPGAAQARIENEGTMTGNITVNQNQSASVALQDLTACSRTTGGCTGTAGSASSAAFSQAFSGGPTVSGMLTSTPYTAATTPFASTGTQQTITGTTVDLSYLSTKQRIFELENSGILDGNITIQDSASSKNTITLEGDGFGRKSDGTVNSATGNITATNGTGDNTLNLLGEGTLRGNVLKFKTLNVGELGGGGGGGDEDDEEEGGSGGTDWTLQSDKTFEFATANLLSGSLDVRGTLKGNTFVGEDATLLGRGTIIGNVTNNGTIDLDDETLHVTGNVSLNDDSKLALAIAPGASDKVNGKLAVTGSMSIEDDSKVAPVLEGVMVFTGDSFTVATTTGGITGLPEVNQFALLHWEAELANANKDLVITAEVADASDIEGMSQPGAAAINALLSSENKLGIALLGIEEEEDAAKAGAQLAPETNFATQQAAITLNQSVGQNIDTRLASAGATGGNFGGASGLGEPMGLGMSQKSSEGLSNLGYSDDGSFVAPRSAALWGQAFGAGLDQDTRQSFDGYDARLYGLMAGYDNWIASNTRLGVAVGYANTGIDSKGFTSRNATDIDSYLVEVYGATKGAGWYVAGRTGFTWHTYDTARVVTVPVAETETGSHDGQQFNASVEVGAPTRMSGAVVTPIASLTYSYLDQDGYVENGGLAAQTVAKQSNDSLVSGLGLKALIPIASDTAIEGRAVWLHEFADTVQTVTASFAAGGSTFTASGPDIGRDTAALGLGIVANIAPESTFQLNYDANVRQDFIGHVGSVRLTVEY